MAHWISTSLNVRNTSLGSHVFCSKNLQLFPMMTSYKPSFLQLNAPMSFSMPRVFVLVRFFQLGSLFSMLTDYLCLSTIWSSSMRNNADWTVNASFRFAIWCLKYLGSDDVVVSCHDGNKLNVRISPARGCFTFFLDMLSSTDERLQNCQKWPLTLRVRLRHWWLLFLFLPVRFVGIVSVDHPWNLQQASFYF